MSTARLLVISLFVTGSGLLGACQQEETDVSRTSDGVMRLGAVEVVDTVNRAVAPSDRPLALEGLRGSVQLSGADRETADLSFVRRGRGESQDDGRSVLEGISITESGTEAEYTYTLGAEESDYAAVDVRGQVPRTTALRIDRLSGSVEIDGVEGALTIDHDHGAVDVEEATAPVEVTIKNGDVRVGFQSVPAEGPLRLQTSNGDVDVGLPPDASVQVDARTNVGTIRTQGLSFSSEQFAPVNAGARYTAQLGKGGPTLEVRTENGSITFQARDTIRADTTEAAADPEPATVPATDTTVSVPGPAPDTNETPRDTSLRDSSTDPDTSS
ncbi:MAG: hypothetical protein BRD51_06965 [Bacteroidetes bacterium SW_11_64_17]|nr:MAG: hypothetical protein BRD51_06965 [Bacteroidetes bacterium SW_11_64_17]